MSGHEPSRDLPAPSGLHAAMRALIPPLLLGTASLACGLAGVGVALHGAAGAAVPAALLYGGFGAGAGLICSLLHWAHHRLPVHDVSAADGPGESPAAALARDMLAQLAASSARAVAGRSAQAAVAPAGPSAAADAPAPATELQGTTR